MTLSHSTVHTYPWSQFAAPHQIDQGTTSLIYKSTLHDLPVVLKLLKPLSQINEPLARERANADLDNELRINAQLRHPNIVLFIGCVATPTGDTGLIFEYATSGCLDVTRYGLSKLKHVLSVAVDVARALAYVHALNIMHRDIKPSQVVLSGEKAMLADWGLARQCTQATATGETGTWEFMAPEVIRHERYGTSADVYSFGMLLYTLLTATKYPYQLLYLTPEQAARSVASKQLRPPISSRIPRDIAQLLLHCWEEDRNGRPQMGDVIDSLHAARKREEESGQGNFLSWIW